jgi:hypothetical protein
MGFLAFQDLENFLHSQKSSNKDQLRLLSHALIDNHVLSVTISADFENYQLRYDTLINKVSIGLSCSSFVYDNVVIFDFSCRPFEMLSCQLNLRPNICSQQRLSIVFNQPNFTPLPPNW